MHHFANVINTQECPGLLLSDFLANNVSTLLDFFIAFLQRALKIADRIYEQVSKDEKGEPEPGEETKTPKK